MERPSGLVLFVAGVPRTGLDELDNPGLSMGGRVLGFFAGGWLQAGVWDRARIVQNSELKADPSWRLPAVQTQVANQVLDVAGSRGLDVTIVDVNRPRGWEEVIEHAVGANESLPILLAPDGSRLVGLESFSRKALERFVPAPARSP